MLRRPVLAALAFALVAGAYASACSGGSDDGSSPTSTPAPAASATSSVPPTPGIDIRDVDLADNVELDELIEEVQGQYVQQDVIYADLTGDDYEEAIVPISTGGTQGVVAYMVFTPSGDSARRILTQMPEGGGVSVDVVDGKLVETAPVPGPDDPECCPSMLRVTTFDWNGSALAIEDVVTQPNPDAGAKPTQPPQPTQAPQ
ncbi:MAG: hypothetical protein WEC75_02210 [Dehalococcoidia bacterium]